MRGVRDDFAARAFDTARAFAPDVVCIAAYQPTQFDEYLARSLPGCRSVGFAGTLYRGLISFGLDLNVSLGRPRLEPSGAQLEAAARRLARVGLEPQTFWVACVGDNEYTAVRNWNHEHWAEVLHAGEPR